LETDDPVLVELLKSQTEDIIIHTKAKSLKIEPPSSQSYDNIVLEKLVHPKCKMILRFDTPLDASKGTKMDTEKQQKRLQKAKESLHNLQERMNNTNYHRVPQNLQEKDRYNANLLVSHFREKLVQLQHEIQELEKAIN
jgi:hypothetical protein